MKQICSIALNEGMLSGALLDVYQVGAVALDPPVLG